MDDKQRDNAIYEVGVSLGFAFAPLIKGLLDGMEDRKIEEAAAATELVEEEQPKTKTQIEDCEKCKCGWCRYTETCEMKTCAGCTDGRWLENCGQYRPNTDGSFNMG